MRPSTKHCALCDAVGATLRVVVTDHVPAGLGSSMTFPREFRICKGKHDGAKLRAENGRLYEVKHRAPRA